MKRLFLISISSFFFCLLSSAQIRETKDGQIVASVGDRMLECYSYQQKSNWCWAASLQMVLSYYKINVTQQELVKRVMDPREDKGASAQEMVEAVNGLQKKKKVVTCWADSVIDLRNVVGEIENGRPVIVGMNYQGKPHAMVLTRIYFQKDRNTEGKIHPTLVIVIDPSRQFLKERKFTWAEFCQEVNMVLHFEVDEIRSSSASTSMSLRSSFALPSLQTR